MATLGRHDAGLMEMGDPGAKPSEAVRSTSIAKEFVALVRRRYNNNTRWGNLTKHDSCGRFDGPLRRGRCSPPRHLAALEPWRRVAGRPP
jgi:hypothetical protein